MRARFKNKLVFKQTPSTAKAYSRYKQLVFMIQKKSEDDQIDVAEAAGRLDVERGSLTLNGYLERQVLKKPRT